MELGAEKVVRVRVGVRVSSSSSSGVRVRVTITVTTSGMRTTFFQVWPEIEGG